MPSPLGAPSSTFASLLWTLGRAALWIFTVPTFILWSGARAMADHDEHVRDVALTSVDQATGLTETEREALRAEYSELRPRELCVGLDAAYAGRAHSLSELCAEYTRHLQIRRVSLFSIGLGLLMAAIGAVAVIVAARAREAQIPAFRWAWGSLRLVSTLQVGLHGGIILATMFRVSKFWIKFYQPLLLLIAGGLALWAVVATLRGIFTKADVVTTAEGALVTEEAAPALWARLRELAAQLDTEPPVRVIGGIDDNFFVTEIPVLLNGERLEGRTLYMSLTLLRGLDAAEAEAVMCHELAHFSGGDTTHSRVFTPLLLNAAQHLDSLLGNPLYLPVYFTLRTLWQGFELALAQTSRERELRADRIAAERTHPEAVARSLLKCAAWSCYRAEVESVLFGQAQVLSSVNIADRVRAGFAEFVGSDGLSRLPIRKTPHPMDSHPPNAERFAAVGVELPESVWPEVLLAPIKHSWNDQIPVAEAVEAALWAEYEARFAAGQRLKVAAELSPRSPEEVDLVEEYYPRRIFLNTEGAHAVVLTWDRLEHDGWFLRHEDISEVMLDDGVLGKQLVLTGAGGKQKINLRTLPEQEQLVQLLGRYLGRARRAKEVREASSG